MSLLLLIILFFLQISSPEIFFKEEFNGNWQERWVYSHNRDESERGNFTVDAPKKCTNRERAKGLKTLNDKRYYQISADIGKSISKQKKKPLIFSFTVYIDEKHECAGTYIKILPEGINQTDFGGDTPFYLMFGGDWCGINSEKLTFLFKRNGTDCEPAEPPKEKIDKGKTHLFTVIIEGTSYEFLHNGKVLIRGRNMMKDFKKCFPPKTIADPNAEEPEDWNNDEFIPDPDHPKPDDWDQPMVIPDPKAKKPKDWDEEEQGVWEAPEIPNPKYKGTWYPKLILNPDFKGPWSKNAPQIPNPEYNESLSMFAQIRYVGIDVWQPSAGSIFDNIIICNDMNDYRAFVKFNWEPAREYEKHLDEEERKKKAAKGNINGEEEGNNNIAVSGPDDKEEEEDDDEEDL